jgi:hypothetical protein
MRPNRTVLALLATPALLLSTTTPATADVAPPALPLSRYEAAAPGNLVSRDAGYSARVPGTNTSLWLFGDTFWNGGFWFGTTAAIGPYTAGQVPTGLSEVPAPPAAMSNPSSRPPAGFLPLFPEGLKTPQGDDCTNDGAQGRIPVSWPSGAAAIPGTTRLLVTYVDVCVFGGPTGERFVVAEYDPATNTLSGTTRVFTDLTGLSPRLTLGSPIFSNGYLYLFGSQCDGRSLGFCTGGQVFLARVRATASRWRDAGSYRFWTGTGWSDDPADATSVVPGAKPSSGVAAGDFSAVGKGFVIVETNDIHGGFTVWRSTSLTGGWTATHVGSTPCSGGGGGLDFCRAHIGHPELSTAGNLLMSYYNPADNHVRVMAVPW